MIINLYQNILRVFAWLPVIWKDRDYDHMFLMYILEFKLKRIRKHLQSSHAIVDLAPLERCLVLLKRINDPDTYFELSGYNDFSKENSEWSFDEPMELTNKRLEFYRIGDDLENKDYDELFVLLRKHVREWWD